ncbi:hydantoinase/oxoprolinase family protein, partial [Planococcus sp. SIMBA_143]
KEIPNKGEKLKEERQVYFEGSGWTNVKVYEKEFLSEGERVNGPAIVEEKTSSTILNDGDVLVKDAYGNMIISIRGNENEL